MSTLSWVAGLLAAGTPVLAGQSFVTPTQTGTAGQDYAGLYREAGGGLRRFAYLASGVLVVMPWPTPIRQATDPRPGDRIEINRYDGPYAQLTTRTSAEHRGLALFVVKDRTKCPEYAWWAPAVLAVGNLTATLVMNGRIVNTDSCTLSNTPDRIEIKYDRLTRVSFVPVVRQAFIYTNRLATGRGYKGLVRFRWSYPEANPSAVRVLVQLGNGATSRLGTFNGAQGSYEFVAESPGRYTFMLEVLDRQGMQVHRDKAVADIP